MADCDVLICGLGPVGQLLALLLDDLGASVIAFDKASEPYELPRVGVVDDEVLRIFQAAGVDEEVMRAAQGAGMQLYCMQLARLEEAGQLTDTIAGLAKYNNTRKAHAVIADARDMLGGNGLLLANHVIRHMGDIEVIHTYEGTEAMQALIVGRDITGVGAFV